MISFQNQNKNEKDPYLSFIMPFHRLNYFFFPLLNILFCCQQNKKKNKRYNIRNTNLKILKKDKFLKHM